MSPGCVGTGIVGDIHHPLIDEHDLNPSALLPHIKGARSPQPVKSFGHPLPLPRLTHPLQPPPSVCLCETKQEILILLEGLEVTKDSVKKTTQKQNLKKKNWLS